MHISGRKREAESRRRRAGEEQAARVTVLLARAVRLVGDSRWATDVSGYDKKPVSRDVGSRSQAAVRSRGCFSGWIASFNSEASAVGILGTAWVIGIPGTRDC